MRILKNAPHECDATLTVTTLEREPDEDLVGVFPGAFYRIQGCIFSGHDVGSMQRVAWDAVAQEWKVVR
jgi:hypothetical protein